PGGWGNLPEASLEGKGAAVVELQNLWTLRPIKPHLLRHTDAKPRASYELIEPFVTSRSPFASDWRCSVPIHILRGLCDPVFRLAHRRTIGAYAERPARAHSAGIWAGVAQAPT